MINVKVISRTIEPQQGNPSPKPPVQCPFLHGEHVSLQPITVDDVAVIIKWWNDPEVRRYARSFFPMTVESEKKWRFEHPEFDQKSDYIGFGIWLNDENRLIGEIGISKITWTDRNCWFGLEIGDKICWGKGHAGEAVTLFLDYIFGELGMHKVIAGIFSLNLRSQAVAKKLGFKLIGVLREHDFVDGSYIDSCVFELFAEEWRV